MRATFFVWYYGFLVRTWQCRHLRDLVKQGDENRFLVIIDDLLLTHGMHYSLLLLHHPCFISHSLFSQSFFTTRISIGQPFAIGQRADILLGELDDDSGGSTKVC
jgi:hypothetical protein